MREREQECTSNGHWSVSPGHGTRDSFSSCFTESRQWYEGILTFSHRWAFHGGGNHRLHSSFFPLCPDAVLVVVSLFIPAISSPITTISSSEQVSSKKEACTTNMRWSVKNWDEQAIEPTPFLQLQVDSTRVVTVVLSSTSTHLSSIPMSAPDITCVITSCTCSSTSSNSPS